MKLVLLGLAVGVLIGYVLRRLYASGYFGPDNWQDRMSELLYGVNATDPVTLLAIVVLLTLVSLSACWLPARRATKVDPLVALRYE